jgi:hypothetical protein
MAGVFMESDALDCNGPILPSNRHLQLPITPGSLDGSQKTAPTPESLRSLSAAIHLAQEVGKGLGPSAILQRSMS